MIRKIRNILMVVICMYITARFPEAVIKVSESGFRIAMDGAGSCITMAREKMAQDAV